MAYSSPKDTAATESSVSLNSKNKLRRHAAYLKLKKAKEYGKRDQRLRRKREENKNPRLREQRRAKNVPTTIEKKRAWDEADDVEGDGLGLSVDVSRLKRQKTEPEQDGGGKDGLTADKLRQVQEQQESGVESDFLGVSEGNDSHSASDDLASLMDDDDDDDDIEGDEESEKDDGGDRNVEALPTNRSGSPPASTTSTNLSLIPDALAAKFPTLIEPPADPKILVTTCHGATIHAEAELITELLPNSHYVRRQRHHHRSHHFSLREISKFAANRGYTCVVVVNEEQKRPSGMTVIHLPKGPTFHFSINNWVEGKKLPGHGRSTDHYPELILNNFRTPLGVLTAHMFQTLFPPRPELEGRQVVTLHNQRDYIFVRRHRYIFRDKRSTEKPVQSADGKLMKGVENIKAGLQELGPRFTLKLRRVDKGIQRDSGQEWEWKTRLEKQRTKFQL
ncbi:MAG: hypothetical protein M1831_002924 [Alyxoria varia]|nr:MAG: hypothetical protein M1831_002924 [Alyxoria varia]